MLFDVILYGVAGGALGWFAVKQGMDANWIIYGFVVGLIVGIVIKSTRHARVK